MKESEIKAEPVAAQAQPPRRSYRTPRLRHLGSVRELILGTSGTSIDAAGFPQPPTRM